jgi:hypothetical protein
MLITMTVLAAFAALALAMSAGYYCGRRAASARPTWKKRTSRVSLGKQTVDLVVSVAARRIRRRLRSEPAVVELLGLRMLASLGLLRGSVTRMRSYRGAPGW